jgi:diacylglycerol kinase family enzyme
MQFSALINTASGSVPDDAEDKLRGALDVPIASCWTCADGSSLSAALHEINFSPNGTLIVWGGDGTVAAALTASIGTGAIILPLPGGTMNLVHQRIHGNPEDWHSILHKARTRGRTADLAYGLANSRPFFVAMLAGNLTRLAPVRESIREGSPLAAARQATSSDALDLETSMTLQINGSTDPATACAAFLPDRLNAECFDLGSIDPDTIMELLVTGASSVLGDWRKADGVDFQQSASLSVQAKTGNPVPIMLDGEPACESERIHVELKTGGVRIRSARS